MSAKSSDASSTALIVAIVAIVAALALPRLATAQGEPVLPGGPLLAATAAADEVPRGQIRFHAYGTADGLRNLAIVSIVQGDSGFLWVATDDGVYRYDGQQFTHYSIQEGLPALAVRVLGVAPDGSVCAGTRVGLACWNGSRFSPAGAEGLPAVWVQALAAGPRSPAASAALQETLWAGTSAGLFVRRGTGAFAPAPGWNGSPAHPVKAIWVDAEGIAVGDGDTLQISAGDGVWRSLGAEVGLGVERIDKVLRDREGTLWIRSVHHLWTLARGAARVSDLSAGLPAGSDSSGVACGMVVSPWGTVLVGSARGIAYRSQDTWQLIDRSVGFPAGDARALFVDREGTVWIGSVGLFQWMGRGLITRHDLASGLPDDVVWSIARDRGALWLGTGRCLAHAVAQRWACLPATEGWSVRSFVFVPQGGIFVGGGSPDLLYLDPAGRPTRLELAGERVADRQILALARHADGDLWIATTTGLYRLAGAVPGRPERVTLPGARAETRYISLVSANGQLWTAGDAGVAVLDHGRWQRFDRAAGFRASEMRHVIRRRDGQICVTFTDVDGLTCFRWDGNAVSGLRNIGLADGLSSGRIYFLGEDRQQRLWIGTGVGIDVLMPQGADHFEERDGLAGNDSAARAFFEDDDGSIWGGSSTGVSHVLGQHYAGPPAAPRTTLLQSSLGGPLLQTDAHARAEVPYGLHTITASFAADSFVDPRRVEFQLRLSPLEHAWSTTRLREARYPALPPGSYELEIRARTGAGAWGPATEIAFDILPAWWQARWFLGMSAALVLACLVGAVTWRQRVLWRRRTRQLHRQSNASFRDLLESIPDLVSVHRDGKLMYLNEAARQMLGLDGPGEPWLGVDLVDRIHPDDRGPGANLFREAHGLGEQSPPHALELRLRAGDDSWRHCELTGRRIEVGGERVAVVSGRDVTERNRLRAKLLLSDRLVSLGTLAAGIAHEINNPLSYVTANLDVVAESLGDVPTATSRETHAELRAAVGDAREGAERVRKIVRGLRTFSRSEEEQRVPLALPEVIDAAVRLAGNELKHRAVLVRELAATPRVLADEGRLAQVFINLLVNAAHAIPEGNTDANRVTVRTRTDEQGRAVVEIADTGGGMPDEVLARAFDPFFTTKEIGEGTGLGLSICHGIVSGLGGQITIESTRGRGCLVRVVLPAAPAAAAAPPPTSTAATGTAGARRHSVMIVDDEPRVAQALARVLHREHDLTLVSCGAEALARVTAGERFDAILTDVMMPNMTGVELFDRLEHVAPDQAMRVVFLTGGVFTPQTQTRLEAAGNMQLHKPVSIQELRACVTKLVARTTS